MAKIAKSVTKPAKAAKTTSVEATTEPVATGAIKIPKGGLTFVNLPIESVSVKKGFNPRTVLGDLDVLKSSIRENGGLLLNPIVVRPTKPGADTYHVVDGHRRLQAYLDMGKKVIPATIRQDIVDETAALAMAMKGNSDEAACPMTPLDKANAFKKLMDSEGKPDASAVGRMCGYTGQHVRFSIKLLLAPDSIRAKVARDELTKQAAIAVADMPDSIRDKVAARVASGTTEAEVRKIGKEVMEEETAAGNAPATATSSTRGNGRVTLGQADAPIIWRKKQEIRERIEEIAAEALNAEFDGVDAEATVLKQRLAELLWVTGAIEKTDVNGREFKRSLDSIKSVLEDTKGDKAEEEEEEAKPVKAKAVAKVAKPKKAKAAAASNAPSDDEAIDDEE